MVITQSHMRRFLFLKSTLKLGKKKKKKEKWHVVHMTDAALGMDSLVLAVAIKEY